MAVSDAAAMSLIMALVPVTSIITIAITVPLTGALTRWRVHYNPRRIQLPPGDEAGEAQSQTASGPGGFFGTLKRVHRLEGWAGLYKGFSPTFVGVLFMMSILIGWLGISKPTLSGKVAHLGPLGYIVETALGIIVGIPLHVVTVRAIVTPYKLPYLNPLVTFKILFSPLERRQPWRIYLLPGLFFSHVAIFAVSIVIIPLLNLILFPLTSLPLFGLAALVYFFFAVALASLQTPLYVAHSRLAVQRARSATEEEEQVNVEVYSPDEEVITIRDDATGPYTGLIECINTMVAEEGWKTLFRAWWITFLGMYFSAMTIAGASALPK